MRLGGDEAQHKVRDINRRAGVSYSPWVWTGALQAQTMEAGGEGKAEGRGGKMGRESIGGEGAKLRKVPAGSVYRLGYFWLEPRGLDGWSELEGWEAS